MQRSIKIRSRTTTTSADPPRNGDKHPRWSPGAHIQLCYDVDGLPAMIVPVTVVEDSDDCVALFLAMGTTVLDRMHIDGSPIPRNIPYERRYLMPFRLGKRVWHSHDRLFLARPGAAHATSLFWDAATREFLAWYVDLQAPLRRTGDGFGSEDYVLDVVIAPDLTWRWKDEDEFEAAQRIGRFSAAQAAAIRAEGESVIETIEARNWPFDAGWEHWRPDPGWTVPTLPADCG